MQEHIYPNEQRFLKENHEIGARGNEWTHSPVLMELMQVAKAKGLWNMFLPIDSAEVAGAAALGQSHGLTNRQYAEVCEILGTSTPMEFASEATNCTSPDTGNMEVLCRYANDEQKAKWLTPLLEGKIRSCFAMTEPEVASSDATNIGINIARDEENGEYVINGTKWWITGSLSLHCKIMILMGKTDTNAPRHQQQSQILVPMDTPGITLLRGMRAMGELDEPKGHAEILFENVRVPFENCLLGDGRGFEISQGRLGPGRIHHCMRLIGQAERCLSALCTRVEERTAFGKKLVKFDTMLQVSQRLY
jgi:alkylation response protein AidB-like acyl-CoA dehydrogenase